MTQPAVACGDPIPGIGRKKPGPVCESMEGPGAGLTVLCVWKLRCCKVELCE